MVGRYVGPKHVLFLTTLDHRLMVCCGIFIQVHEHMKKARERDDKTSAEPEQKKERRLFNEEDGLHLILCFALL